ncbi:hypothetical protein G7046_g6826 [Stylonectria norvegica]|nr:hypothetical protein G7046_g6826 [Stylonectria norvegica]
MAIPWDSLRSLLIFFGPLLLPKAISYYRTVRSASRTTNNPIQPVPPRVRTALGLLFVLAVVCLVKTLPPFSQENLFDRTQSRLQIPVDVLFNRVATLRPDGALTAQDLSLRAKFVNLESRLIYLQFGPAVVAECPFCNSDEPKSYFYYAITSLLWPHISNLVVLALVTSPTLTGRHGAGWRSTATIAAGCLAALEVYLVSSYNYQANARALRLGDMDPFFWSMRTYRLIALAALDAGLGFLLYLSSTNRAFNQPPSTAERVELVNRALLGVKSKLNALGIVKNTALRDEDLRAHSGAYWTYEARLMREVMEEREVIEGVNDALGSRINIRNITREAEAYAQSVLQPLHSLNGEK